MALATCHRLERHALATCGLQAIAIAAERLQLVLAPSICSQLHQGTTATTWLGAAARASQGVAPWHSVPQQGWARTPWPAAAAATSSKAAGAAQVRWRSAGPQHLEGKERGQQPASDNSKSGVFESFSRAGWSRREVFNVPNGLSVLRLLSGPVIAAWIVQGQWHLALPSLAVSGATDWADGFVARRFNQRSVLGSYLDPLADKALMCSVVAAMGYTGDLSGPMVGLILGRDVFLVFGAFAARAQMLGWRWPGAGEFFRLGPAPGGSASASASGSGNSSSSGVADSTALPQSSSSGAAPAAAGSKGCQQQQQQEQEQEQQQEAQQEAGGSIGPSPAPAAPFVEPLYISKVNTALQLGLVGSAMAHAWLGWPSADAVWWVAAGTAGTTVASCAAYVRAFMAGNLLTAGGKGSGAGGKS